MKYFVLVSATTIFLAGCSEYHPAEVSRTPPRWTDDEVASFNHFMESLRLMEELKKELPKLKPNQPAEVRRFDAMYQNVLRETNLVESECLSKAHPDLPRMFDQWYLPWVKDQFASYHRRPGNPDYGRYELKQWNAWCKENWKNVRSPSGVVQLPGSRETNASGDKKETAPARSTEDAPASDNRGTAGSANNEFDKAIQNLGEAIPPNPQRALAFYNRGNEWWNKGELDLAIDDYTEAIRLDPQYALAYRGRGFAWYHKGKYVQAIRDFQETLRLDPKEAYAAIFGHFAARSLADHFDTRRFVNDWARNLNHAWPYPVVRFLRHEIDERQLLNLADNDDKRTEAHCYLGLDLVINGHRSEALAHFRWVKEHGNKSSFEYAIADIELERLE